jgi:broad specificity phosphatase PhoE
VLEIWFIRHAETDWNAQARWQGHSDPDLSPRGQEQCRRLAARLAPVAFDAVYSSDLARARSTASLALPHQPALLDSRLRELHMGLLEGNTWEELAPQVRAEAEAFWGDPFGRRLPGGEGLADLSRRLQSWMAELPRAGRVAAFTHGGVIRCALWSLTGPPRGRPQPVVLDNTSITRLGYGPGGPVLRALNDTSHLADLPADQGPWTRIR